MGMVAVCIKAIFNTFYYNPNFLGKVIISPILEELFKSLTLYIVLYYGLKKTEIDYPLLYWYMLGIFTGTGFGFLEAIWAYRLLEKPSLLHDRIAATMSHIATTYIDGLGITNYITLEQLRWLTTIGIGIIIHGGWNWWVNYAH